MSNPRPHPSPQGYMHSYATRWTTPTYTGTAYNKPHSPLPHIGHTYQLHSVLPISLTTPTCGSMAPPTTALALPVAMATALTELLSLSAM